MCFTLSIPLPFYYIVRYMYFIVVCFAVTYRIFTCQVNNYKQDLKLDAFAFCFLMLTFDDRLNINLIHGIENLMVQFLFLFFSFLVNLLLYSHFQYFWCNFCTYLYFFLHIFAFLLLKVTHSVSISFSFIAVHYLYCLLSQMQADTFQAQPN